MKSSKLIPLLVVSFLLSLTFMHYKPSSVTRNLLEMYQINEICDKTSDDLMSRYTKHDFTYEPDKKVHSEALIRYIKDNDIKHIIEYLPQVAPFGILFLIGICSCVGWFFYCFCCCCPSCCCKPNSNNKPGCCGYTSSIILLAIYGIIVALAVTNFGLSTTLLEGINGASCAFFKFYDTVLHGESEEVQLPRWDGIEKIVNKLDETAELIKDIDFNVSPSAIEEIEKQTDEINDTIQTLDNEVPLIRESITNVSSEIDLLKTYTPKNNPDSELGQIYNEYINHIKVPFTILNNSQKPFEEIINNKREFSNSLSKSANTISKIENRFNDIADKVLDEWYTLQSKINSYGPILYFLLCGFFFFFGVLGFLSTMFYCCCKCGCMKFTLHLTWNFFTFLAFVGMLIGSICCLVGKVSSDAVGVVSFLFRDNLQSDEVLFFREGKSTELINICINGDGNMRETLNLNEMMEPLNQLYNLSKFMNESYKNVSGYDFPVLEGVKKKYDNCKDTSEWVIKTYAEVRNEMMGKEVMFLFKEDENVCPKEENCRYFENYIQEGNEELLSNETDQYGISLKSKIQDLIIYSSVCQTYLNENSSIRTSHETMRKVRKVATDGDKSLQKNLETELSNRKEFTNKLYSIFSSILGEPQDNSTTNVFDIINCGMYTYI